MSEPSDSEPPRPGEQAEPPSEEERKLAGEDEHDGGEQAETETAEGESSEEPPPRAVVPRWVQLVLLPIAILALWELAKASGKVLVIFIVAALIALILNPAVSFVQRRGLPRGLSVLAVYLAFFLILAGIGLLVANPISNQVAAFSRNIPHLTKQANHTLVSWEHTLNSSGVHIHFKKQGKTALQTLGDKINKGSSSIVSFGGGLLTELVSAGFDLLLVFVLSVYMLIYGQRIGVLVRRFMPSGDGSPADDYPVLVQHALARYVGGQLLFSLIMGTTASVALYVIGVLGVFPDGRHYAIAFGVFYGLMELVPYIGPIVGALPPVLVALFTNPITAVWVALMFVALQQLEGHIVAPQIFGHTLRINPLLVIFALLLGLQVHGVVGALIALPILSVLRETAVYLSRHLAFEPWGQASREIP
ncbi:MAG TPA: AI-2E family transporter [Solirubrobacteraceae bacterium]